MQNKADKCVILFALAGFFMMLGNICLLNSFHETPQFKEYAQKTELPEPARTPIVERIVPQAVTEHHELKRRMGEVQLVCTRLVLGNSYRMFITAYCAEECGWNYSTSSGATCHRSSWVNRYEPTTVAIDRSYFKYGDMFYIPSEDRVYIAEDTGPGVRGLWLDTYQDDMSDVTGYNTRYETVYLCEVEYYTVNASYYDVCDLIRNNLLTFES